MICKPRSCSSILPVVAVEYSSCCSSNARLKRAQSNKFCFLLVCATRAIRFFSHIDYSVPHSNEHSSIVSPCAWIFIFTQQRTICLSKILIGLRRMVKYGKKGLQDRRLGSNALRSLTDVCANA